MTHNHYGPPRTKQKNSGRNENVFPGCISFCKNNGTFERIRSKTPDAFAKEIKNLLRTAEHEGVSTDKVIHVLQGITEHMLSRSIMLDERDSVAFGHYLDILKAVIHQLSN